MDDFKSLQIHDRVKYLRKKILNLTQAELGNELGVSRDVIKNIEIGILAKPEQKLPLYKLMCSTFGIREEWLLNGDGEPYAELEEDEYSKAVAELGIKDELAKAIIVNYWKLDDKSKERFYQFLSNVYDDFKKKKGF